MAILAQNVRWLAMASFCEAPTLLVGTGLSVECRPRDSSPTGYDQGIIQVPGVLESDNIKAEPSSKPPGPRAPSPFASSSSALPPASPTALMELDTPLAEGAAEAEPRKLRGSKGGPQGGPESWRNSEDRVRCELAGSGS